VKKIAIFRKEPKTDEKGKVIINKRTGKRKQTMLDHISTESNQRNHLVKD